MYDIGKIEIDIITKTQQYIAGIESRSIQLPEAIKEAELLDVIHGLNNDESVDGILVQLPVPDHITERRVCNAVDPSKDVDGFNVINVGRFCSDQMTFIPATPAGVMEMLRRTGISLLKVISHKPFFNTIGRIKFILEYKEYANTVDSL